ncbi:hypothetical protein DL96DRAFT_911866 [Flagelloscypha sp. PMI_526]|nr:hypothetical protein DL96DRAFT_911866 [Flagelloscypha sp. PMI_526]
MPGYLAPELISSVLSFFRAEEDGQENTDRPTLAQCSLVSHTWLPLAQPLLFRDVALTDSFAACLVGGTVLERVRGYIRAVYLSGGSSTSAEDLRMLVTALSLLPNLSTLRIDGRRGKRLSGTPRPSILLPMLMERIEVTAKIERLELTGMRVESIETLFSFLQSFKMLKEIKLDGVTWELHSVEAPDSVSSLAQLTQLRIRNTGMEVLEVFQGCKLDHVSMSRMPLDDPLILCPFLEAQASTMQSLTLGIGAFSQPAIQELLPTLTQLRFLRIHDIVLYDFPQTPVTPSAPTTSFSTVPPVQSLPISLLALKSSLSELHLAVWVSSVDALQRSGFRLPPIEGVKLNIDVFGAGPTFPDIRHAIMNGHDYMELDHKIEVNAIHLWE